LPLFPLLMHVFHAKRIDKKRRGTTANIRLRKRLQQISETIKEKGSIRRTWSGLRVKLHTHKGFGVMSNDFLGTIIGIDKPGRPLRRQSIGFHGKSMVLRSYKTSFCAHLSARLILTSMPKLHFVSFGTCRKRKNLMAKTYPKYRPISTKQFSHTGNRGLAHLRVARSIGNHNTIKIVAQKIIIPGNSLEFRVPQGYE